MKLPKSKDINKDNKDINRDIKDIPLTKLTTNFTTKEKKPEQLSRRDLEDLMGLSRSTYKRVRGAVRSKR